MRELMWDRNGGFSNDFEWKEEKPVFVCLRIGLLPAVGRAGDTGAKQRRSSSRAGLPRFLLARRAGDFSRPIPGPTVGVSERPGRRCSGSRRPG